jgi:hypothetical protein
VLPDEIVLRHVSTPADLTQALRAFCDADVGEEVGRWIGPRALARGK